MNLSASAKTVGQLVVERPIAGFERLGVRAADPQLRCRDRGVGAEVAPEEAAGNGSSASLTDLCDHIEQTHHAYMTQELLQLEYLTNKVAVRHGNTRPALRELHQVFVALKAEVDC